MHNRDPCCNIPIPPRNPLSTICATPFVQSGFSLRVAPDKVHSNLVGPHYLDGCTLGEGGMSWKQLIVRHAKWCAEARYVIVWETGGRPACVCMFARVLARRQVYQRPCAIHRPSIGGDPTNPASAKTFGTTAAGKSSYKVYRGDGNLIQSIIRSPGLSKKKMLGVIGLSTSRVGSDKGLRSFRRYLAGGLRVKTIVF